jgi:uncharacterized protein (DUF2236 family)
MSITLVTRENTEPLEDYGFFGPDSVTWKVWGSATSFALGFMRSVSIEQLDPNLNAAVIETGDVYHRTRTRYDRTLHYFALVMFGDSIAATKAANVLVKIHAKAVGDDPVTGGRYDANDPDSQLWIHMTAWHSILKCYEMYGPGKLDPAEEDRYWAECAVAAELQTINIADVPRSRAEVRAYFEAWRPRLAGSEQAQRMMNYLFDTTESAMGPMPPRLSWLRRLVVRWHRWAIIATLPRYQRFMAGVHQPRWLDAIVVPVTRWLYKPLFWRPVRPLLATSARWASPSTLPVVAPMFLGIAPRDPRTYTPAQARERLEILPPREEYARFLAVLEQRRRAGATTPEELGVGPDTTESRELIGPTA